MARKKEPELVDINRRKILAAANSLILKNGIERTSMDEVARAVGMSKSTLYVYFRSKEELKNYIALDAMNYFYQQLKEQITGGHSDVHDVYMKVCFTFVDMKEKYPLSFQTIVQDIAVDDQSLAENSMLLEIYEIGEKINHLFLDEIVTNKADVKEMLRIIFTQWGSIYGLITLADNKEVYIEKMMGLTKEEFLRKGFEQLFKSME